ncbi:MAG TPA: class I adenylate-forming enzyme family protein [Burkholderiales bacterium]|nr:class I adenylate-forming enzyme family protein [Burkholderiales bacterium]
MTSVLSLLSPRTAQRYYEQGVWRHDTLYSLLARHAAERAEEYALRDAQVRLSWRELLTWVETVAERLDRDGVRRGQRVSVWLPSRAESVVTLLACARNGYICSPSLHQNYTVGEIVQLLQRSRSAVLVMQAGYGADAGRTDVLAAAQALPFMRAVYSVPGSSARPDLRARAYPAADARLRPSVAPDDDPDRIIYLAFTSGTTGAPKGVMHSHNTLLANGRAMVEDWRHDHRTILLSLSPMSHHIGTVALEQMLAAGLELVVNDPPPDSEPLDWILETGATYVMGVPTHAIDVLAEVRRRGLRTIGAVRIFYMAGSPIPREVAQSLLDMGIKPQNIYGMTENGSHQYTLPTDDEITIVETCGRAAKGYETRIFSQENADVELPAGEVGEIGTRGALLMLGYFDDQVTTEESFNRDGWFMSGDLGTLDERGCLRFVGRKKDLIIRGGHNIHPARIEDLAHRHPAVLKASAFGVPDERLGEKLCLAVIVRAGERVAADAMLDHLHAVGLSKYDMPEYFIVLDAFPLTASGKILKRELAQWAQSGRIRPQAVRWVDPVKKEA